VAVGKLTITLLIIFLNALSATVLAFFAGCGVVANLLRRFAPQLFSRQKFFRIRLLTLPFCAAIIAAFALEVTVFNWPYYVKFFADGEVYVTDGSTEGPGLILTDSSVTAKMFFDKDDTNGYPYGITFEGLDRRVTSLLAVPVFYDPDGLVDISVEWSGEMGGGRAAKRLYSGFFYDCHTALPPGGKVSEVTLRFKKRPYIQHISINRQIPLYFSGLRLFAFSCLFYAVILLLIKGLRNRGGQPVTFRRRIAYASIAMGLFLGLVIYSSTAPGLNDPVLLRYLEYSLGIRY